MKTKNIILSVFIIILFITTSCSNDDDLNGVETLSVRFIEPQKVELKSETFTDASLISEVGFVWNESLADISFGGYNNCSACDEVSNEFSTQITHTEIFAKKCYRMYSKSGNNTSMSGYVECPQLIDFDDFSDNHNQWFELDTVMKRNGKCVDLKVQVNNGRYEFLYNEEDEVCYNQKDYSFHSYVLDLLPLPNRSYLVEINVGFIGDEYESSAGIHYEVSQKNGKLTAYGFFIDKNQTFNLISLNEDLILETVFPNPKLCPAIFPDKNNNIKIACFENGETDHYVFYVNDIKVHEYRAWHGARTSFLGSMFNYGHVWYDDVSVSYLEADSIVQPQFMEIASR